MTTVLDGGSDFVGLRPLLQRIDAVLQGQEKEAPALVAFFWFF